MGGREPALRHHLDGHDQADSWATDAHKWLNVPYDCGIAVCAHPEDHEAAMEYAAPYLAVADSSAIRDPMGYSPEFSCRARSAPVWAAIRQLGRSGVASSWSAAAPTRSGSRSRSPSFRGASC